MDYSSRYQRALQPNVYLYESPALLHLNKSPNWGLQHPTVIPWPLNYMWRINNMFHVTGLLIRFTSLMMKGMHFLLLGESAQAHDQPEVYTPSLCPLPHPQRDQDSWGHGEPPGDAPAALQRSAGGHQDLQEGLPQQNPVRGLQTEVQMENKQRRGRICNVSVCWYLMTIPSLHCICWFQIPYSESHCHSRGAVHWQQEGIRKTAGQSWHWPWTVPIWTHQGLSWVKWRKNKLTFIQLYFLVIRFISKCRCSSKLVFWVFLRRWETTVLPSSSLEFNHEHVEYLLDLSSRKLLNAG